VIQRVIVYSFPFLLTLAFGSLQAEKILFVGDFHFGQLYQQKEEEEGRVNILKKYGYSKGFSHLKDLLQSADHIIANLETPVSTLKKSPYRGKKAYLHNEPPSPFFEAIANFPFTAFSLANNHSMDFGTKAMKETLNIFREKGIPIMGAGFNLSQAQEPFFFRLWLT